jgi:hypothetical protein
MKFDEGNIRAADGFSREAKQRVNIPVPIVKHFIPPVNGPTPISKQSATL